MKPTGIIRRIDDLGRVVIPKAIRKQCRIHEGDPLEIYIGDEGVTFKRYSELALQPEILKTAARMLETQLGHPVVICDCDGVIASSQSFAHKMRGLISDELEHHVRKGKEYLANDSDAAFSPVNDKSVQPVLAMMPLRGSLDIVGGIVVLRNTDTTKPHDYLMEALRIAAGILQATIDDAGD